MMRKLKYWADNIMYNFKFNFNATHKSLQIHIPIYTTPVKMTGGSFMVLNKKIIKK
jgi:hypothetical protein